MKQFSKVLLSVICLVFATAFVFAANPESDFHYELTEDGEGMVIKGYFGDKPNVVIPDTIQGFPVYEIGDCVFAGTRVTSVYIPDTVDTIGDACFAGNTALKTVNIPKSVYEIGDYAFYNCTSLTEIQLPDTIEEYGDGVFYGSGISAITLPKNMTEVPPFFCSRCPNLKKVIVSSGVKVIHEGAFSFCTKLSDFMVPSSNTTFEYPVENLQSDAFYNSKNPTLSLKKQQAIKKTGYKGQF